MKKTLIIFLVLLISTFAVFSEAEGNTITLNSTVSPLTDYLFTLAATSPTTGLDASSSGSASFEVTSDHVMNFASDPTAIDITVSVTPWQGSSLGQTNTVTLGTLTATGDIVSQSGAVYTVDYEAGYKGTFDVGTFDVTWGDKETLAADTYTATITIEYIES